MKLRFDTLTFAADYMYHIGDNIPDDDYRTQEKAFPIYLFGQRLVSELKDMVADKNGEVDLDLSSEEKSILTGFFMYQIDSLTGKI